ncbi:MAG: cytochrome c biogenesis protein CcsA [Pseudomonadota bacterium]|nr:cytochrome c biogenesis protein CcsA [Pseudomonadota bacterium]
MGKSVQFLFKHVFVSRVFLAWIEKALWPSYYLCVGLLGFGLYHGLYTVPVDVTQGEVFRIIYIHVPLAVLSLGLYCGVGMCAILERGLHMKIASAYALSLSIVGALCTLLAIITGAIWAKPTWGTWWVWDARLTSELILLMLYISYISVRMCIKPIEVSRKIAAYIAMLGMIDIPFVHYSVEWWYTLHQGSTILHFAKPKMPWMMLWPLLICILASFGLIAVMVMHTTSVVLLIEKKRKQERLKS